MAWKFYLINQVKLWRTICRYLQNKELLLHIIFNEGLFNLVEEEIYLS